MWEPEDAKAEDEEGALCDVAPATVLDLLGLPKPEEMTGRSLFSRTDEKK
ncbi:hypothetical protein C8R44DRAFT_877020 [Mycena epipterygia]|nr:hypothetical protein C8R44DRAFT_877020 [Mycena epipterygia]